MLLNHIVIDWDDPPNNRGAFGVHKIITFAGSGFRMLRVCGKKKGEKKTHHGSGRNTLFLPWSCHGSVESGMSPVSLFPLTWEQFSSEP